MFPTTKHSQLFFNDILSAFVLFSVSQASNIVLENAFTSLSAPRKRLLTYAVFLSVGVDNKFYVP